MKSSSAFFILFSLFLFASVIDGRKDVGNYWKGAMNGDPMPKALENLVQQDPNSSKDHFTKDFDTRHPAIIYHRHDESKQVKPLVGQLQAHGMTVELGG